MLLDCGDRMRIVPWKRSSVSRYNFFHFSRPQPATTTMPVAAVNKVFVNKNRINNVDTDEMVLPVDGIVPNCASNNNSSSNNITKKPLIQFKNAEMSYGKGKDKKEILQEFNMTVGQGTM
jgi:hypothetical protein